MDQVIETLQLGQAYLIVNSSKVALMLLLTLIIGGPLSATALDTMEHLKDETEAWRVWTSYGTAWTLAALIGLTASGLDGTALNRAKDKVQYDKKIELAISKGKHNVERRK